MLKAGVTVFKASVLFFPCSYLADRFRLKDINPKYSQSLLMWVEVMCRPLQDGLHPCSAERRPLRKIGGRPFHIWEALGNFSDNQVADACPWTKKKNNNKKANLYYTRTKMSPFNRSIERWSKKKRMCALMCVHVCLRACVCRGWDICDYTYLRDHLCSRKGSLEM